MEKQLKKKQITYVYNWTTSLYTWNIVNQLRSNMK